MTEGYPGFVANNGRAGLGLNEAALHRWEFGAEALSHCHGQLIALGLDPDVYRMVSVHPWPWGHMSAVPFAPDLARLDLVHLGDSVDTYRPQQSIRTFFGLTNPVCSYVETALTVQNMGLECPPATRSRLPPSLRRRGSEEGPHTTMIAALRRDSPVRRLGDDEPAFTLAALLAPLDVDPLPVARCLPIHGVVFMPHGEDVILVVGTDQKPRRAVFKDIGEEVAVARDVPGRPLPPEINCICLVVDAEPATPGIHVAGRQGRSRRDPPPPGRRCSPGRSGTRA